MGNSLRLLYGHCCKTTSTAGGSSATVGVSALQHDLFKFDNTAQVPQGLSEHVVSSKKAQANWYRKLLAAWKQAKRPPTTSEEAARFVVRTLKGNQKQDVEGFLAFYSLSWVPTTFPVPDNQKVEFELVTFPVDGRAVADGDTVTVYVNTDEPPESSLVPQQVRLDLEERSYHRSQRNYKAADALHDKIIDNGYRVLRSKYGGEILGRKYKIQLRGVNAPRREEPYGEESKEELTKLVEGKCLRVLVYGEDEYHRYVSDVYAIGNNEVFVQREMLRRGGARHYKCYDGHPQLASWENEAKKKRLGLWALPNYM